MAILKIEPNVINTQAEFSFGNLTVAGNIEVGSTVIATTETGDIAFNTSTGTVEFNSNTVSFLANVAVTGPAGAVGYTGSAGTDGYTGSRGVGFTGSQGVAGIAGFTGSKGDTGLGFTIAKSYASVAALTADTSPTGIVTGQFAIIETGNVEDAENSRLYLWNGSSYSYINDLSGAAGLTGPVGPQGAAGFTGSAGTNGFTGSAGTGFTGSSGSTGFTGSIGLQGPIGYTGSAGTGGAGGSLAPWQTISANYSVSDTDRLLLNSSTGSFTLTLPSLPQAGAYIQLIDTANLFTNPVYVDPNGSTIEGSSSQLALDVSDASIELVYDGTTWHVTSTYGPRGPIGLTGSAGTNGFTGSAGFVGSSGTNGFTGSLGYTGSTGAGYTGSASTVIGFTGSAGLNDWQVITASYSPQNKDRILVNTSSGSFNLTLPAVPAIGYYFLVSDAADLSVNSVIVDPNGLTIEGSSNQLALDVSNATFEFIYDGSTWQVTSTIGPKGDKGYTGSAGAGFTGSQGFAGYNGSVGFTGSAGTNGFTGSAGAGFTGSQGVAGFIGSAGLKDWTRVTGNYTAVERDRLLLDTSSGSFTVTLPQTPTTGAYIQLSDAADLSVSSVIVNPNGSTIEGSTNQLALDVSNATFEFIYDGSTWQITSTIGPKGDRGYTGSSGVRPWAVTSANISASAGDNLFVNTSVSSVEVTLPATATLGDQISIVDAEANAAVNNIVVNRNGHAINGASQNLVINTNGDVVVLAYYNVSRGWVSVNK